MFIIVWPLLVRFIFYLMGQLFSVDSVWLFGISPLHLSCGGLFSGPDAARNRFVSTLRGRWASALAKRVLNCSADGI